MSRLHVDANQCNSVLRSSLCGFLNVRTVPMCDAEQATCKLCLTRLRAGSTTMAATPHQHARRGLPTASEFAGELHIALTTAPTSAPSAGAPPHLTPDLWAASCKGGEHRRCGACEVCRWERDADRWAAVSPWNDQAHHARPEGGPRWETLAQALNALARWHLDGRATVGARSTLGGVLELLQRGECGERDGRQREPRAVAAALEVVDVERALARAYEAGHGGLTGEVCAAVLLARTAGINATVETYEALALRHSTIEATIRAVVKHGRARVTEDLFERGLIARPRGRARYVASTPTYPRSATLAAAAG